MRKSSTSGSQRRKSSAPVRKIGNDVEKSHDDVNDSIDDILAMFDLPALYQRAVNNVHAKLANMSSEEIEKAAKSARDRLNGKSNVLEEELSTDSDTEEIPPSGKTIANLIKYPTTVGQAAFLSQIQLDPPKSVVRRQSGKNGPVLGSPTKQLRNSGLVEDVKKSKENASLGSQKSGVIRQSSKNGPVSESPTKQLRNSGLVENMKKSKENISSLDSPKSVVRTQSAKNVPASGSSTKQLKNSGLVENMKSKENISSLDSPKSVVRTQSTKNVPVSGSSTKQLRKSGLVENMEKSKENNAPLPNKQVRTRRPPLKFVPETDSFLIRIKRRRLQCNTKRVMVFNRKRAQQKNSSGLVENEKSKEDNASSGSRKSVVRRQSNKNGHVSRSPTKQL